MQVIIEDSALRQAAQEGMDAFVAAFTDATLQAIGGGLNAGNMAQLNNDQLTLLAYHILRDEVMDGGFVQLIYNGYGPFFFKNPVAKMFRLWELPELAKLINKGRDLYERHAGEIERELSDDEFMALFEQFPQFDALDDAFIENEEQWTAAVARYIDGHIEQFAEIKE